MIKLIPITDPAILQLHWPFYVKGVERALDFSRDDIGLNEIYNDVWGGKALMWVVYTDDQYTGFVATKVVNYPKSRSLLIYMAYSNVKNLKEDYVHTFDQLIEYAKASGCNKLEFYTIRDKAFERVLDPFGWKPKWTVFEKEV